MNQPPLIPYICILIAMLMPFIYSVLSRSAVSKRDYVGAPRAFNRHLDGWHQRAHWAQLNAFENFPPFAVACLTAWFAGVEGPWFNGLAIAFVVFRVAHGVCYLSDRPSLRSLCWQFGMMCTLGIFLLPLFG